MNLFWQLANWQELKLVLATLNLGCNHSVSSKNPPHFQKSNNSLMAQCSFVALSYHIFECHCVLQFKYIITVSQSLMSFDFRFLYIIEFNSANSRLWQVSHLTPRRPVEPCQSFYCVDFFLYWTTDAKVIGISLPF